MPQGQVRVLVADRSRHSESIGKLTHRVEIAVAGIHFEYRPSGSSCGCMEEENAARVAARVASVLGVEVERA